MAVWTCSKCGATQEMDDKPEFCGSCGEPFKEKKVEDWKDKPLGHEKAIAAVEWLSMKADNACSALMREAEELRTAKIDNQERYENSLKSSDSKRVLSIENAKEQIKAERERLTSRKKSANNLMASCNDFRSSLKGKVLAVARNSMDIDADFTRVTTALNEKDSAYAALLNAMINDADATFEKENNVAKNEQIQADEDAENRYTRRSNEIKQELSDSLKGTFGREALHAYNNQVQHMRFGVSPYTCPEEIPEYIPIGTIGVTIPNRTAEENAVAQAIDLQASDFSSKEDGYTVRIPYAQSFRDGISLFMSYSKMDKAFVTELMQPLLLKLFFMFPAGKLEATIIDPYNMGSSFPNITSLVQGPEYDRIIDTKVWTKEEDIEKAISTFYQNMETITQDYGEDWESRLRMEEVKVLVVTDFPAKLSSDALKNLQSIIRNHAKAGVCVLICASEEEMAGVQSKDISLFNDISRSMVEVTSENGTLYFNRRGKYRFFLEVDTMQDVMEKKDEIFEIFKRGVSSCVRREIKFPELFSFDINDSNNWGMGNHDAIEIPIGIRGANQIVNLIVGKSGGNTDHHALVSGQTGAGKSTFLHTLILSALVNYSPDELQLYLLDFKEGVEFNPYTQQKLPSLRVIALNSEREFGLIVLRELCREMETRSNTFAQCGCSDINSYNAVDRDVKIPKILMIFDEVQELFRNGIDGSEDSITKESIACIGRLVMQGRAMGIHLILACQDFKNCAGLESVFSQIAIRIAVKGSEEGAASILRSDNDGIRTLQNKPAGAAIYNNHEGVASANNFFQIAFANNEYRLALIERLGNYYSSLPDGILTSVKPTRVLITKLEINSNNRFNKLMAYGPESIGDRKKNDEYEMILGQGYGKDSEFKIKLGREKDNLLVVTRDEKTSLALFVISALSLLHEELKTDADKNNKLIYFINLNNENLDITDDQCDTKFLCEQFPKQVELISKFKMHDCISSLYDTLLDRSTGEKPSDERIFVMFFGINRAHNLKEQSIYDDVDSSNISVLEKLKEIILKGPAFGINTIAWTESLKGLADLLGNNGYSMFNKRIAYKLPEDEMSSFVMEENPKTLHGKTAVYMDVLRDNANTHFRPFDIPSRNWIENYADTYETIVGEEE